MRVWLDPDRLQSVGLTASDVVTALQGQNVQVASGVLDQPPVDKPGAFQIAVQTLGRLTDPDEFGNIVVKQTANAVVRVKDVATVELAAQDYSIEFLSRSRSGGRDRRFPAARLECARDREDHPARPWTTCRKRFPPGLKYTIVYNPTAIHPAVGRCGQNRRSARRSCWSCWWSSCSCRPGARRSFPIVAIPVSLIGTFFVDGAVRLYAQQPVAVRAGARDRHRGRRRHRRRGERRAQYRRRA